MNNRAIKFINGLIAAIMVLILSRNLYLEYYKFSSYELGRGQLVRKSIGADIYLFFDESIFVFDETDIFSKAEVEGRVPVGTIVGYLNGSLRTYENIDDINNSTDTSFPVISTAEYNSFISALLSRKQHSISEFKQFTYFLEEKGRTLSSLISDDGVATPEAGYIYYEVDGYEEIFTFDSIFRLGIGDIITGEDLINPTKKEINGFKVVNNNVWYALVKIEDEILKLTEGNKVALTIDSQEIRGTIKEVIVRDSSSLLKVRFTEGYKLVEGKRCMRSDVTVSEEHVYRIPKTAIVKGDQVDYVFRINGEGVAERVKVKLLGEEEGKLLVIQGREGTIEINGSPERTLDSYDEILIHPNAVRDGELVRRWEK